MKIPPSCLSLLRELSTDFFIGRVAAGRRSSSAVPLVTRPVRHSPRQPPKNAKRRSEKSGCPSIHQTLKTIDLRPTELGNSGSGLYHHYRLHFNKRISGIVESSLQISQGEICNSDGGGSVVVMIYWKLTSSGAEISSFLAYKK